MFFNSSCSKRIVAALTGLALVGQPLLAAAAAYEHRLQVIDLRVTGPSAQPSNAGSKATAANAELTGVPVSASQGSLVVTVTNSGVAAMTLAGVTGVSAPWSLSGSTCTSVAPGDTCQLTFSLATDSVGVFNQQVSTVGATVNSSFQLKGTVLGSLARWGATGVDFGNVSLGQSVQRAVSLHNDGTELADFSALTALPAGVSASLSSCTAVAAGASCPVTFTYQPTAVGSLSASGVHPVETERLRAVNQLTLAGDVAGVPSLGVSATTLPFGQVNVGTSAQLTVRLTNSGTASATLSHLPSLSGDASYTASSNCGSILLSGATCDTTVTYAPKTAGATTATLQFANPAGSAINVALSGTGLQASGTLVAAPGSSANFGVVGTTAPTTQTFVFTNTGNRAVSGVVASVTGADLSLVPASNTCGTSVQPGTLPANATCSMTVQWAPTVGGFLNGNVSVASTADNSPTTLALTGASTQSLVLDYSGRMRYFVVTETGDYVVQALGAQGGSYANGSYVGGKGAQADCTVSLSAGTVLKMLVGQQGVNASFYGGGGGGTFVAALDNTPLCVAGGGGGAALNKNGIAALGISGSTQGLGGTAGTVAHSVGGGGGFNTDGGTSPSLAGGKSFVNGGAGGGTTGGFGGGSDGGAGNYVGGSGGGFNGGSCTNCSSPATAGGSAGSSYISGTGSATTGVRSGNGRVFVTAPAGAGLLEVGMAALAPAAGSATDFGVVGLGYPVTETFTYSNISSVALTGVAASVSGDAAMTMSANSCGTAGAPVSLAVGASCSVTVRYAPTAIGPSAATNLILSSSASGSPGVLALHGVGELQQVYGVTSSVRYMQVEESGTYKFDIAGAQGGTGRLSYVGGNGARVVCQASLTAGTVVKLAVGQQGTTTGLYGTGGGGTFVSTSDNTPLCVAGGGGGAGYNGSGTAGQGLSGTGVGGTAGAALYTQGGGGGFSTDGGNSPSVNGGKAFVNGAAGAAAGSGTTAGGFGGGAAGGSSNYVGGPGGGYNGGSYIAGGYGTGGTSYSIGTPLTVTAGAQTGNGKVVVSTPALMTEVAMGTLKVAAGSSTDFGMVGVGFNTTRTYTYINLSSISLTGVTASVGGDMAMSITSNTCGSAGAPGTLGAGATCSLTVRYAPTQPGTAAATSLTVASSSFAGSSSLALTGAAELQQVLGYTGAVRYLRVEQSGTYKFDVAGAQGGQGRLSYVGGNGARVVCQATLSAGTVLKVLVGRQGTYATWYGTGGGGTFVATSDNAPLCVAGGGGGAGYSSSGQAGQGLSGTGVGGTAGTALYTQGGGGGFYTDGGDSPSLKGGKAFVNGGAGGAAGTGSVAGSYGGGAAGGSSNYVGGPGGGYNGGAYIAAGYGTGGTSFSIGTALSVTAGAQAGNGTVTVSSPALLTEVVGP